MRHREIQALFAAWLCLTGMAAAETPSGTQVYDQALRGTALIQMEKSFGTGWVADGERRLVVTNYHVVKEATTARVIFPKFKDGQVVADRGQYSIKEAVTARVLDRDPKTDLAILQVERLPEGAHVLKPARERPRPGQRLHLVGNAEVSAGLWVYTTGTVRQVVHRTVRYSCGQEVSCRMIETQMPGNPGDSGSAVVDDEGRVVGIYSGFKASPAARSLDWAVDAAELRPLINEAARALEGIPPTAQIHENRGGRLVRRKRYPEAIEALTRAIELDGKRVGAFAMRARAYWETKDRNRAEDDYTRAIRLEPDNLGFYLLRGEVCLEAGRHVPALGDFSRVVKALPNEALGRYRRGQAHRGLSHDDEALADFSAAIRLNPKMLQAYEARAQQYRLAGKFDLAVADLRAALKLEPGPTALPLLLAQLGHVLGQAGNHAESLTTFLAAVRAKHPEKAMVWVWVGDAWQALKQFDEALKAYDLAIAADPKIAIAWYNRGTVWAKLGQTARAEADFSQALKREPALAKRLKSTPTHGGA